LAATHDVKTFFFSKQGNSSAEVTFEKDCYTLNEIVEAKVRLDNSKCEKDVNKVTL